MPQQTGANKALGQGVKQINEPVRRAAGGQGCVRVMCRRLISAGADLPHEARRGNDKGARDYADRAALHQAGPVTLRRHHVPADHERDS